MDRKGFFKYIKIFEINYMFYIQPMQSSNIKNINIKKNIFISFLQFCKFKEEEIKWSYCFLLFV